MWTNPENADRLNVKHVTSEHVLQVLARLHRELARLLGTEHGRRGLTSVLWYIEGVHPELSWPAIVEGLRPLVGTEIANTMMTFEQMLEKPFIEKTKRLARQEGIQEGRTEGKQELFLRLLARRFGALPEAVAARVMNAGQEELERWSDRILDAASLDDVFAAP